MNKTSIIKTCLKFLPQSRCRLTLTFPFILLALLSAHAQTTLKERLEQHVYTLASDSLRGRQAGTVYARMAADYIVRQFEEIGIEPYFENSYLQTFRKGKFQNIVGIIRGYDADLKDEYIVVGAHYDHIGASGKTINNGADDNASGTAALIELGRELKRNQSSLKRSVMLIAFDAEESGLVGSSYFVFRSEAPIENIKLMIALDMIGWYKASGKLKYIGSGTIKDGDDLILNPQLVPSGLNVVAEKFETKYFAIGATDTQPFALKRIPTLWAFTGFKSPYHTPQDEAHLIDYDGMALITEHLTGLTETFSQDSDLEPSGKFAKSHVPRRRISYSFSANFGTSYFKNTEDENDSESANLSFGVGFTPQVNFGIFAIRPELHYDRIQIQQPDGKIATNRITVPVSLVLQTPEYMFFGGDVFFGGYYSYLLGGKQGVEKLDFENACNRTEAGLTFGFGWHLKPFTMGITGRTALTDFTKISNANKAPLRNRTFYFTMRYMF